MTSAPLMTGEAFEGEDDGTYIYTTIYTAPQYSAWTTIDGETRIEPIVMNTPRYMPPPPYPHRRGWRFHVTLTRDRVALWLERAARWVRG